MKNHFENFKRVDIEFGEEHAVDVILHFLHDGFSNFIQNFNMNSLENNSNELLGMLKTAKHTIPTKTKKEVLMLWKKKSVFKKNAKVSKIS